jgi:hypothetical protein
MRTTICLSLLALAGCGVAPSAADQQPLRGIDMAGASPTPFFGESVDRRYLAGDIVTLTLLPDGAPSSPADLTESRVRHETGTYARRRCPATPCYDATPSQGTYELSFVHRGPGTLYFYGDSEHGRVLLDRYQWQSDPSGVLWLRERSSRRWSALKQFPDESLCDSSAGQWRDDDPNPATGLYCDCPTTSYWNPAAGGCIPRP